MKTMIPAVAGTYLLVPWMDFGSDDYQCCTTRVPILGWSNYSAAKDDVADVRTGATPIVPYWPEGVSQAAAYLIPVLDEGERQDCIICVPFARETFDGPSAMDRYMDFAETLLRGMEEERNQEDAISGEASARLEAAPQGDVLTLELDQGVYSITPAEDTREVGTTLTGNARRSKEEIAADETFLDIVKGLGKTIRAVNTRWKTTPSRTAVLRDLAGMKDEPEENVPETVADDDDEDLIG